METNNQTTQNRFIPVSKWADYHAWPSIAGLRWLIFHAKTNGFQNCLARVGRRVLISEKDFFVWLESKKESTCHK